MEMEMKMKTFTGRFMVLANEWRVVVNTGTPDVGDEIRVRRADKSVVTMIVEAVTGTWTGKAVCRATQRRTESVYSQIHTNDVYPATHPSNAAIAKRLADRLERGEGRSDYERKYQIGL
jgi:hypothetical protein